LGQISQDFQSSLADGRLYMYQSKRRKLSTMKRQRKSRETGCQHCILIY